MAEGAAPIASAAPGPGIAVAPPARLSGRQLVGIRAIGALSAGLMLLMLILWPGIAGLGNIAFDGYQRLHPRSLDAMTVRTVDIDAASLHAIGGWPWSRYDVARLTELIVKKGHPAAVGFDMFFPDVDRQAPDQIVARYGAELTPAERAALRRLPSMDDAFALVLGNSPAVLARAGVTTAETKSEERIYTDIAALPVEARFTAALPSGVEQWPQALSSLPAIEEVGHGFGLINGAPDADGVVRRIPAVGALRGVANSGFALELARLARNSDTITPVVEDGTLRAVRFAATTLPVDPDGRFRLHFGRWPTGAAISALTVFRRNFDFATFAGKVVIIGLTSGGSPDVATTPLVTRDFGSHVQAQAVDAILRGGWLVRPPWAPFAETALGLVLALLTILVLPRVSGRRAAALLAAAVLLVVAASWAGFVALALLLDPLRPLLIGGAAATGTLATVFGATVANQRTLQRALHAQALVTERAEGELKAAREIQFGMVKSPDILAATDPAIDIGAVLEPARLVGGDFYDAFALDRGRVAFLIADVSGKGVDAALFMALSKALSESAIRQADGDLAAALGILAEDLGRQNAADMFVTMLGGVIDVAAGTLDLFNAGHENPFLIRAGGAIEELAMEGGPPIGAVDSFPYEVEHHVFARGDGLLLITDGVIDAEDGTGAAFGRDGVLRALAELPSDWTAHAATALMVGRVRAFEAGGEAFDDLTLLALRRR